ncbi:MAG TPA: sulfotransferase [Candidatus Limnocylindrales bacterium]|nr:sulfotransferase [Candidatus Limnocylindrales bacterium]
MRLDIGRLHEDVSRVTGLTDFGDESYVEGLRVLAEAYEDAGLTRVGASMKRSFLRGGLMARLFSEAAWRAHPEYEKVAVERPVFVTGLPRTGTTALHRMLVADPAHQGVELWLADVPQPRPPRETWSSHPIFQMLSSGYQESSERLGKLHHVAAEQVEECWYLLRQSMLSVSFECLAHVPGYSLWLREQDWTAAYARHRRNLQLIGLNDLGQRWVLKNPSHLFALDALMAVYPDALVIQTHRAPHEAIASVCSLNAQATEGWSTVFVGEVIGRDQLELWARGLELFTRARAKYDPAQFVDVRYEELVADPDAVLRSVYARLGRPVEHAVPMRRGAAEHVYSLADFGLTREQVDQRFARMGS